MVRTLLLLCALASPQPTMAGGMVTLEISPQTSREAELLRLGLAILAQRHGGAAAVFDQSGRENSARLRQSGSAHRGVISQRGRGHVAEIVQNGGGHAFGVFQSGRGTSARIAQSGRGSVGLLLQHGW